MAKEPMTVMSMMTTARPQTGGAADALRRLAVIAVAAGPLVGLSACQAVGSEPAPPASTVSVLAQADAQCPDSGSRSPAGDGASPAPVATVYRDAASLRTAVSQTPQLADWRVDFASGETVLRIDAGALPNPGWRLRGDAPRFDVGRLVLVVPAAVEPPAPGSFHAQVISFPCRYLHLAPVGNQSVEIVSPTSAR